VDDLARAGSGRGSVIGRTATLAAVLLISMGAQGGPGPRLSPSGRGDDPRAGVVTDTARPVAPAPVAPAPAFVASNVVLTLTPISSAFDHPVLVTNAGDGTGRLFVVEQNSGLIRVISNGIVLPTPFLDLHRSLSTGGERGLLGLAFHPRYPTVPYFYVNFTDVAGNTAIFRFRVSADPNVGDLSSGKRLLTVNQPYPNHNGGNLAFGPDGYLYIGMGDGGGAGDPGDRAQNLNSLLGKMLRIDVDHTSGTKRYAIPSSNPYVGRTGLDEIWSRGLRNPWRWSFDRLRGTLWIGDVGQNRYEEIDRAIKPAAGWASRAENYGWDVLEGRACYEPPSGCSTSGKHVPLVTYGHAVAGADNCAVTGGFVYRGTADPVLQGGYVYGDFCSGRIWVLDANTRSPGAPVLVRDATASPQLALSSFGEDEDGELYACDLAAGTIYRIRAQPKP
jgi:glucose/arabinose dehydrogenase